jgi:hypothetical protein
MRERVTGVREGYLYPAECPWVVWGVSSGKADEEDHITRYVVPF